MIWGFEGFMEIILLRTALFCYFLAAVLAFSRAYSRKTGLYRYGIIVSLAGALAHSVSLISRGIQHSYFPVTNIFEAFSGLAILIVLCNVGAYFVWKAKSLSLFVFPSAFLLTLASDFLHGQVFPVRPEHKNFWLGLHAGLNLIGLCAFMLHFLFALMYLLQEANLKSKKRTPSSRWLPPLLLCDELGYKSLVAGFPFFTLGIITGALLALNVKRSWSPFETLTLIIWIIFAFLIEARLMTGWRGKKAAYLSIFGFLLLFFASIGIILF